MKKTFLLLSFLFSVLLVNSQTVTVSNVAQSGDNIVITYSLTGGTAGQTFDVSLLLSEDGKVTWKKLTSVTGDVGVVKTTGTGKKITWSVLTEPSRTQLIGDNIYFKVKCSVTTPASTEVEIPSLITDGDGNIYTTITIGTQTWLKENLKTTKYNDGTAITNVTDDTKWASLTTAAYCWYDNNSAKYKATYGALYNWYAVDKASNGNKNICPVGYHVPTKAEYQKLLTNVGGSGTVSAKALVTTGNSGFSALLTGGRSSGGDFSLIGTYAIFWSSTTSGSGNAWYMGMYSSDANVSSSYQESGYSVRCFRD